ncbi:thioesterase II family protein [Bacillus cereus]|uniref:thioesterase II family protein n=1 Tax=Bacillus cereus TaxID=1396 RepID=UPI0013752BCC|nr:thioesterase [Bacillus cereus]
MKIKSTSISKNLVSFKTKSNNKYRMFCFPHAGGSSSFFHSWAEKLENIGIELVAIQLPGREKRINENLYLEMDKIISDLVDEIVKYTDKPFLFFGHSLGGMISYELCKELCKEDKPLPLHLIISSCRVPHLTKVKKSVHDLSDDELAEKLKILNGSPEFILKNKDFQELYFPMIRADFSIAESYHSNEFYRLPIDISCFLGDHDTVSEADVLGWEEYTLKKFNYQLFNGDHFYLKENTEEIINYVEQITNYIKV